MYLLNQYLHYMEYIPNCLYYSILFYIRVSLFHRITIAEGFIPFTLENLNSIQNKAVNNGLLLYIITYYKMCFSPIK